MSCLTSNSNTKTDRDRGGALRFLPPTPRSIRVRTARFSIGLRIGPDKSADPPDSGIDSRTGSVKLGRVEY